MGKLHELLAVEDTVVAASEKLISETNEKFNKHSEFFTGGLRILERLKDSPEDRAQELVFRVNKALPTDVIDTLGYIFPFIDKTLSVKLQKHRANQIAVADILLDGVLVIADAPVDFLLDLEKAIPRWRSMFVAMPTLDPSREWVEERKGVWKSKEPVITAQTEKVMYPVVLSPATPQHPAQVKEAVREVVIGKFLATTFSGAATSQQKADVLALCDRFLAAVKQARMRANSVDVTNDAVKITSLFAKVFE